jgi:hypothetical protein
MNKTKTTMGWMTMALLAGALSLPGLALADRGDGHGHKRHHHEHRDHWRHQDYGRRGHWDRDRRVVVVREPRRVVVREPVYVESPRAVVAPLWAPLTSGITLVLRSDW